MDVVYLNFNKAFDISHSILMKKLAELMAWTGVLFAGLKAGWMAGPRDW